MVGMCPGFSFSPSRSVSLLNSWLSKTRGDWDGPLVVHSFQFKCWSWTLSFLYWYISSWFLTLCYRV
jgi:hypothetical protein